MLDTYSGYMQALHGLPYVVVICMVFYTILWYKNGNWCCCSNGKFIDFCCLILPQMVFWLVSFAIMMVFTALGYFIAIVFDVTTIDALPGTPKIQQLIDHIIAEYSDFWNLCFKDLVGGLEFFRWATTIFSVVGLMIFFHSCCFCCCKPYESESSTKAEG